MICMNLQILVDLLEILTGFPIPKDTFSGMGGSMPSKSF